MTATATTDLIQNDIAATGGSYFSHLVVYPTAAPAALVAALPYIYAAAPVGSRVTCSPPPVDTDEDWLVLVRSDPQDAMLTSGFNQDGSPQFYTGNDAGGFRSWRLGDLNVITTEDAAFYERFMTATHLAKRFNLLAKGDRIALFQAVLYGVDARNLEAPEYREYSSCHI